MSRQDKHLPLAADKIEVTPEMVEAGAAVLRQYDPREDASADVATEIYLAMQRVSEVAKRHSGSSSSVFPADRSGGAIGR